MLKLSVTLILEAHCPSCGREDLPLGENTRYGVVAVCPGCGWEHRVQFLQKGSFIDTQEVLTGISQELQEALARMDLPQDVHLTPARERRDSIPAEWLTGSEESSEETPPSPPSELLDEPEEKPPPGTEE